MSLNKKFPHSIDDVIIVKCDKNNYYYAKIKNIDKRRRKCKVLFDDNSTDDASFENVFSVGDTTTEIVCIICKSGSSESPNEIVLCDQCGIGYHQECHVPQIPNSVLQPDAPWLCRYCQSDEICPFFVTNPFTGEKDMKGKNKLISQRQRKNRLGEATVSVETQICKGKDKKCNAKKPPLRRNKRATEIKVNSHESPRNTSEDEDDIAEEEGPEYMEGPRRKRRAAVEARKRVQLYLQETGVANDSDADSTAATKKVSPINTGMHSNNAHGINDPSFLTESSAVSNFPMATTGNFGNSSNVNLPANCGIGGVQVQSPVMMPQQVMNDHLMHNNPNQVFGLTNGLMKSPSIQSPTLNQFTPSIGSDMQTSPTFVGDSFQLPTNGINQQLQTPYYQPQAQTIGNVDYASQTLAGYNSPVQNFANPHLQLTSQVGPQYGNHSHLYTQHHSHHVPPIHGQDAHYQHLANFHNMPAQDVTGYNIPQYNQYHWLPHQQQSQSMQHLPAQYAVSAMQSVGGGLGLALSTGQQYPLSQHSTTGQQDSQTRVSQSVEPQLLPIGVSSSNVSNFSVSNLYTTSDEPKDSLDKEAVPMSTEPAVLEEPANTYMNIPTKSESTIHSENSGIQRVKDTHIHQDSSKTDDVENDKKSSSDVVDSVEAKNNASSKDDDSDLNKSRVDQQCNKLDEKNSVTSMDCDDIHKKEKRLNKTDFRKKKDEVEKHTNLKTSKFVEATQQSDVDSKTSSTVVETTNSNDNLEHATNSKDESLHERDTNASGMWDSLKSSTCSGDILQPCKIDIQLNHICDNCQRPAALVCSGCVTTWYCGQLCQKEAWDSHRKSCKNVAQ